MPLHRVRPAFVPSTVLATCVALGIACSAADAAVRAADAPPPAGAAASAPATPVAATPSDIVQARIATAALINLLVEQGVITRERGDVLLQELVEAAKAEDAAVAAGKAPPAGGPAADGKPLPPGTVRVPYIPEFVRKEIKDELRADLQAQAVREGWAGPGAVPEWVRALKWDGDIRFRTEYDNFISDNAPAVSVTDTNRLRTLTLLNTTEDRLRLRVRARLGLAAAIDENWSGTLRLTTGSATDPLSSNQTLGNYNNRYTVAFDRANIRYRRGDTVNVVAGRFGNPWFGTDLVWANDLSFDGVAAQWLPALGSDSRAFFTVAALPVQEVELSKADKWLLGAQVGIEAGHLLGQVRGKLGLALYNYRNILGKTSPTGSVINEFTAPLFAQKGNTYYNISSDAAKPLLGLASDFKLVNLTGLLDIPVVSGKHALLSGDFVRNVGFDRVAVSDRVGTDVAPKTIGWMLRLAFGDPEVTRAGEWQLFSSYKHVDRDAVLDAFTDSDFRMGGTDAKGYTIGGSYGVGRNTAAGLRWMSGDSVSGAPLSIDLLQLDLLVRF